MFAPEVIAADVFDGVIAGTGDREHPFDATVLNRVYMFKDKVRTTTPPVNSSGTALQSTITEGTGTGTPMLNVTSNCIQDEAACTGTAPELASGGFTASQNTANALTASTNYGWYLTLATGEKQIGGTVATGGGAVQFATNQPSASAGGGACSPNLGVAKQYVVNFLNGTAIQDINSSGAINTADRASTYAGGGFLPSPVLVYVDLGGEAGTGSTSTSTVPVGGSVQASGQLGVGGGGGTGGGATSVVCFGASCALAPGVQLYSRLRKFWYKEMD
jgi:type IV pilus assembly protein PilY1